MCKKAKKINSKKNKYIYPSYTNHYYYNNNHYTMGIFSCPCCVCCPAGVCGGEQELVKTFTSWKILASLENTGSGTGGYVFLRITAVSGALYSAENNGRTAMVQGDIFGRE